MPKELIYSSNPTTDVVEHFAVGWEKDRGVQLGAIEGPSVTVTVNGEEVPPGLWMDLDRGQINRLIHCLRRARDAAFGADA